MKEFKRIISILLIALMAVSLCACSKDDKGGSEADSSSQTDSSESSTETSVTPTPVPEKEVDVVVVTGDGVFIRADASTDNTPLGYADSGDTFQLVSADDSDWYAITYNGETAYITTLYSEIQSITESAYNAMFPEPEVSEESSDGESAAEESNGVVAEETRNSEDGER